MIVLVSFDWLKQLQKSNIWSNETLIINKWLRSQFKFIQSNLSHYFDTWLQATVLQKIITLWAFWASTMIVRCDYKQWYKFATDFNKTRMHFNACNSMLSKLKWIVLHLLSLHKVRAFLVNETNNLAKSFDSTR